jgi:hypothetical protein
MTKKQAKARWDAYLKYRKENNRSRGDKPSQERRGDKLNQSY